MKITTPSEKKGELRSDFDQRMEMVFTGNQFKHLKFSKEKDQHIVTLIDNLEYEVIKGYGNTIVEAINDMHSNLI